MSNSRAEDWDSHVLPHGGLVQLSSRLWVVTGSLASGPLPRNMIVYRLNAGGLLIHSAVALNPAGMAALEELGRPQILIVPNGYHRLDAGAYRARYPNAQVLAPSAARARIEKAVKVDRNAEDELPKLGIKVHQPRGIKPGELVYELALDDGVALVFTDALFNVDRMAGVTGSVANFLSSGGELGVGRVFRWVSITDRQAYKGWLEEMSKLPGLSAVSVSHGRPITQDPGAALMAVAQKI
jgi:hypothetical protein